MQVCDVELHQVQFARKYEAEQPLIKQPASLSEFAVNYVGKLDQLDQLMIYLFLFGKTQRLS